MMRKAHICFAVLMTLMTATSCGQSDTSVNTSDLTEQEKEWVEFSYAHEKNEDVKRTWEQLPADGVKSYLEEQRPRLCGDTAELMQSLKEAGYEAGEMQEYKEKTARLIC